MLTTAITFATSKKLAALAAASGVAASAMFAGNASLQQEIRAMPAPILVEADLGSMLRLGGGSGGTAEANASTTASAGASLTTEGSLLTEVNATLGTLGLGAGVTGDIATGTAGVATEVEASAGTGARVDLGINAEAAVAADLLQADIVADAGGVLGITLR